MSAIKDQLDILCIFGRPIEKVNDEWELSTYFERVLETGIHPGIRCDSLDPNSDDKRILIAGAHVNALGGTILFEKLRKDGVPPKIVIFSAGRPPYLQKNPDPTLTEARIFKNFFLKNPNYNEAETEIILQTQNINSYGDVIETLRFAQARGFQRIGIVTLTVHIARCQEFYAHALAMESSFKSLKIHWFASEFLVLEKFPSEYKFLWEAFISKAYARTAEHERRGIQAIRQGTYAFNAPGFTQRR